MSGTISFNPYATTAPANSFLLQSQGYVQGMAMDDPAVRMELTGGVLAASEALAMWGGVPITEAINVTGSGSDGTGPAIKRATTQNGVTGWSVYNQASSMVITPGPSAPVSGKGGYVAFFRNGTNARIAVQLDPALVAAITEGEAISALALQWDPMSFRVTNATGGSIFALPASARLLSVNSNSKIVTYNSETGAATWTAGDAGILLI